MDIRTIKHLLNIQQPEQWFILAFPSQYQYIPIEDMFFQLVIVALRDACEAQHRLIAILNHNDGEILRSHAQGNAVKSVAQKEKMTANGKRKR